MRIGSCAPPGRRASPACPRPMGRGHGPPASRPTVIGRRSAPGVRDTRRRGHRSRRGGPRPDVEFEASLRCRLEPEEAGEVHRVTVVLEHLGRLGSLAQIGGEQVRVELGPRRVGGVGDLEGPAGEKHEAAHPRTHEDLDRFGQQLLVADEELRARPRHLRSRRPVMVQTRRPFVNTSRTRCVGIRNEWRSTPSSARWPSTTRRVRCQARKRRERPRAAPGSSTAMSLPIAAFVRSVGVHRGQRTPDVVEPVHNGVHGGRSLFEPDRLNTLSPVSDGRQTVGTHDAARPPFVVVEGPNGAGKSTLAHGLVGALGMTRRALPRRLLPSDAGAPPGPSR